jgi:hypothetical protein
LRIFIEAVGFGKHVQIFKKEPGVDGQASDLADSELTADTDIHPALNEIAYGLLPLQVVELNVARHPMAGRIVL